MSSELDALIEVGHNVLATKYYAAACGAILFYDYLLTLPDEIEYIWVARKSWISWVFVANRYFPMTHILWGFVLWESSSPESKVCEKASWYPLFTYVISVSLVQVVVTLRVYAVTMKNIPIVIGFGIITVSQFALGIFCLVADIKGGAEKFPQIPFGAFHACAFVRHRPLEIAYTGISLIYEFLTFALIIFLANASRTQGLEIPRILKTITKDATLYFLVIFTSHFTLMMTLLFAPSGIQLLPGSGIAVFLPVMISRIVLSLRKAARSQQGGKALGEHAPGGTNLESMRFVRPRRGINEEEASIPLDSLSQP